MPPSAEIARNLDDIRARIQTAAARAGRSASDVTLVAVSKTFSAEHVRLAAAAGQSEFGENRVQEGLDKSGALQELGLTWHLIGHLQSNKSRKAAAAFGWIHSIDSVSLLRKVDDAARDLGVRPRILVQVDLAGEDTKFGAAESGVADLVKAALDAGAVDLRGLMIIPPIPDHPEQSRPWFRRLRSLRDELAAEGMPAGSLRELSMGMSQDFEVAIEEGATMVRVGSAIFGARPPIA